LYGAARIGDLVVNRMRALAVILLSATVLALGGCGRKGGLDLPPNAASQADTAVLADGAAERAAKPSVFNPTYGSDVSPTAPKGAKRGFVLDPLLND
jgi:predicted small lipoprotein YifL